MSPSVNFISNSLSFDMLKTTEEEEGKKSGFSFVDQIHRQKISH